MKLCSLSLAFPILWRLLFGSPLPFGCMFQFPLVTYALIRADIVYYETVCHARPYVVVGILVLAALLTPPDIVSQLILGVPTYLLFEAGLLAARRFKKR
ncbi:twin-arginine translocase subunit TatC [Fibrobacter sp. UWH9]|uniref:twin-arginine translocase subunit TatC n=1 Tax=Fibrobacter sp. UWH9 TaxID=1896213 RepID=UPI00211019DB|nr:twin-arginine translocase subunit TatC [Fibrobacter sp. UWH9]